MSYARRYLLCMLLNIVTTDDDNDGNGDFVITEQAVEIDLLISSSGANKKLFLQKYKITDVRELLAKDFLEAKKLLELKKAGKK